MRTPPPRPVLPALILALLAAGVLNQQEGYERYREIPLRDLNQ